MKLAVYFFGILANVLVIAGACFKILHLVGANAILILALGLDLFVFTPLLIVYLRRKKIT